MAEVKEDRLVNKVGMVDAVEGVVVLVEVLEAPHKDIAEDATQEVEEVWEVQDRQEEEQVLAWLFQLQVAPLSILLEVMVDSVQALQEQTV
jgi:hypothetical protein